ncbi:hypothetical protein B0H34DRAFT_104721 [Crassisporium funariophilum]|nr:hypothetical protein B0H34DRAFT_104721 [Crassisporium funariophilum]
MVHFILFRYSLQIMQAHRVSIPQKPAAAYRSPNYAGLSAIGFQFPRDIVSTPTTQAVAGVILVRKYHPRDIPRCAPSASSGEPSAYYDDDLQNKAIEEACAHSLHPVWYRHPSDPVFEKLKLTKLTGLQSHRNTANMEAADDFKMILCRSLGWSKAKTLNRVALR